MKLKLSAKINILIVCTVILTGIIVGSLAIEATTNSFDDFTRDLWQYRISTQSKYYLDYYTSNGYSWEGVENAAANQHAYNNQSAQHFMDITSIGVILTDTEGEILVHPEKGMVGGHISQNLLPYGNALKLGDDKVVGYIYPDAYFNSRFWYLEQSFSHRVLVAIIRGIVLTSIFAMLLGVAISKMIVTPLKELISAISQMSKGDFNEQLPVYSDDELGELSRSFNTMAEEIDNETTIRQQMFADISHELKTPLTVLATKLETSLERNKPLDTVDVAALYDEVIRLKSMVGEMQDLSRLEAKQTVLNKTLVDFKTFFSEFLVLIEAEAEDRKIDFQVNIAPAVAYCYADPYRLKQIVLNLVNNALRYTPEGGKVELKVESDENNFIIMVKDNGMGISPEDLPYIFQRFYRAEKSRERSRGGSGLGLAITKGFVEAHGGTISVESALGKGSTFVVKLPLYREEDE